MTTPHQILKEYFGHSDFRPGQLELIEAILDGRDAFGIMPTGGGKSICYQVPALLLSGITLVISPLISLMQDQIYSLKQNGIDAAFINSQLTDPQIDKVLNNARLGLYKIIYVAPERIQSSKFLDFCKNSNISFVAVDESHCVSQWGQDFRPSYSKIPEFVSNFRNRPIIGAYTATATHAVKTDVVELLNLKNPTIVQNSFDRSNLKFEVIQPDDRFKTLVHLLKSHKNEYGIIYCSTRKTVNTLYENLRRLKYSVGMYHAGMGDAERKQAQDDFIFDRTNIIIATNAFGMGIDKSNVSFVIHYNMPKDIESYYQEAGRAGRDGSDASCTLLYNGQDVMTNLYFIDNDKDKQYESDQQKLALQTIARQRLKTMQRYCTTNSCLRNYILRYFGEVRDNKCDNCGSCDIETLDYDITILSQKILSCVARTNQIYGINTIVGILRGSKDKKILSSGLDRQTTYGICKESETILKSTINHLIDYDYLYQTDDKFMSLRLGEKSNEVLKTKSPLSMTIASDDINNKSNKPKKRSRSFEYDFDSDETNTYIEKRFFVKCWGVATPPIENIF